MKKLHLSSFACCLLLVVVTSCGDDHVGPGASEEPTCIDFATEPGLRGFVRVGQINSIDVSDGLLVAGGRWAWLSFFDVSDPNSPSFASRLPHAADHVRIEGSLAYATSALDEFLVIDVTDAHASRVVGSLDLPSLPGAHQLEVRNGRAYVVVLTNTRQRWLRAIDVSDPANPSLVWSAHLPSFVFDVAASDSHVFVAEGTDGLRILDAATGATLDHELDLPGPIHFVSLDAETAYVAGQRTGIHMVDISDPASLANRGPIGPGRFSAVIYELITTRGHLIVVTAVHIHVLTLADPNSSTPAGRLSDVGPEVVAADGSMLYLLRRDGVAIADLGDFQFSPPIARRTFGGTIRDIMMVDDVLYTFGSTIQTARVSRDGISEPLGWLGVRSTGSVTISQEVAYLQSEELLRVVDVGDPAALSELGSVEIAGPNPRLIPLATRAGMVYGALWEGRLLVIDATNPAQPSIDKRIPFVAGVSDLVVGEQHVYAIGSDEGLVVMDITDPGSPVEVGRLVMTGKKGALVGDYLVVLDGKSTFVVDVSDPTQPVPIAEHQGARAIRLLAEDQWVYVLEQETVRVLDLLDPTQPRVVGQLSLDDGTFMIHLSKHGLVAATRQSASLYPRHCP